MRRASETSSGRIIEALERFEGYLSPLSPITCEIAMIGSLGLNAPAKIHRLQSILGTITVLYLLFLQYVAFQLLDSAIDDVIDLSVEYLPDFWTFRGDMP